MYTFDELPVEPAVAGEINALPLRVLLALPPYTTIGAPPFNLPGAINDLLGKQGWERATKVMRPCVWAPGWDDRQLRDFVTAPFGRGKYTIPPDAVEGLRQHRFSTPPTSPGRSRSRPYEIIHFHGDVVLSEHREGSLLLNDGRDLGDRGLMSAEALRDMLIDRRVRLLILQIHCDWAWDDATHLGEYLVREGGPAVLVVRGDDPENLSAYFTNLYLKITHNLNLSKVADPWPDRVREGSDLPGINEEGLSLRLLYGSGGEELLKFDRWVGLLRRRAENLRVQVQRPAALTLEPEFREMSQFLHSSQLPLFQSKVEEARRRLEGLGRRRSAEVENIFPELDWARESGAALPLTHLTERIDRLEGVARSVEDVYPQVRHELRDSLRQMAKDAPRVLNANAADPRTKRVLGPRQGLVAGEVYDWLVDVGPVWNTIPSIVKGNKDFPERALPPDEDGYVIKVVLVSDDFQAVGGEGDGGDEAEPVEQGGEPEGQGFEPFDIDAEVPDDVISPAEAKETSTPTAEFRPCLAYAYIWVPRNTGRSYPLVQGKRASSHGPVALRTRAPNFPEGSDQKVIDARARLCLYYQANLLQSAVVRVGVVRTPDQVELEVENEVAVDFVLSGSFRDLSKFAARPIRSPEGEAGVYPVALNLTLNDDGANGHRIIVEQHAELTVWRPYDPEAEKEALADTRERLLNCFWEKLPSNCGLQRREGDRKDGLSPKDNGKTMQQFKCDLLWLAMHGATLYQRAIGQIDRPHWLEWRADLQQALVPRRVIQVARTGPAQYVFPWNLVYDIPLPGRKKLSSLRWCDILKEQWSADGKRQEPAAPVKQRAEGCPYQERGWHQSDTLCPYGFWGMKHYVEQPINRLKSWREGGDGPEALDVPTLLNWAGALELAVGVTRDKTLDAKRIATHLNSIKGIAAYTPERGADDLDQVHQMLMSPELVYFLCHGKYDPERKQPYIGIGLPEDDGTRVYPEDLLAWAQTQGRGFWKGRHPIIFINGCHTSNLTPGEILNFVTAFAKLGASAVIGTEVSVRLPLAVEIAERLLRKIADGVEVGEAMLQVRWELANKGNLLGLAYTPYCMTNLQIARA